MKQTDIARELDAAAVQDGFCGAVSVTPAGEVLGAPDSGAFCTVRDMTRFWRALLGGDVLSEPVLAEVPRPHQRDIEGHSGLHNGLGVLRVATARDANSVLPARGGRGGVLRLAVLA